MSSVRLLFDEKLVFKLKEVTKEVFQKTLGTDCEQIARLKKEKSTTIKNYLLLAKLTLSNLSQILMLLAKIVKS